MIKFKYLILISLLVLCLPLISACTSKQALKIEVNGDAISDYKTSTDDRFISTSSVTSTISVKDHPIKATTTEKVTVLIPTSFELRVAFAQQAPFANWDELHEESCEEASMIMAAKYFHKENLDETIMEQEIQGLIGWQKERSFGVDLTAEETQIILKEYFGLNAKLTTDVSVDRIKYELSKGNLIIVPAAGRELGNPNFKQPGPIYHMLVIKGYSGSQFITNDPGTRKGNGWRYDFEKLINSVHDWNHQLAEGGMTDQEMALGQRIMIIVSK
ncbi:MAG: C39 family peptidase [Candidatus Buchananbacteria bacterium]